MDRDQFDRLSRLVAAAGTRRDALRLLVAGAVAGAAGSVTDAEAGKRGRRARQGKRTRGEAALQCTNLCINCAGKRIGPGTNLSRCDFDGRNLAGVNLASSNLTGACFARANLTNASFRSANVTDVCFCGADLSGADFRGTRVTAEQLACATVSCTTILPNGKRATCPPCTTCVDGRCIAVPNDSVACDGSPLRDAGSSKCTTNAGTGICVDGACSCGFGVYDPARNVCRCDTATTSDCARNPPPTQCCQVEQVCTGGTTGFNCVACA